MHFIIRGIFIFKTFISFFLSNLCFTLFSAFWFPLQKKREIQSGCEFNNNDHNDRIISDVFNSGSCGVKKKAYTGIDLSVKNSTNARFYREKKIEEKLPQKNFYAFISCKKKRTKMRIQKNKFEQRNILRRISGLRLFVRISYGVHILWFSLLLLFHLVFHVIFCA